MALVGFVGLCLLTGAVDAMSARAGFHGWFVARLPVSLAPPAWLFPSGWSLSAVSMAVAAWLVWCDAGVSRPRHYRALRLWGWQLLAGGLWAPVFFTGRTGALVAALGIAIAGVALVGLTMRRFWVLSKGAAFLMAPALLWSGYTATLNATALAAMR